MPVPLPPDETQRLEALRRLRILETPPDEVVDGLARLAAHACDAPVALVAFVDAERVWFKARIGLELEELPRDASFCAHTVRQGDVLVVADAGADPRFADTPLVKGEPAVRFYAGAPLVTADGQALGVLCVMDRQVRELAPAQREALRILARQVMTHLEVRRHIAEIEHSLEDWSRAEDLLRRARPPADEPPAADAARGRRLRGPAAAAGAFLIPLGLTLLGYRASTASVERSRQQRLERAVEQVSGSIRERMDAYQKVLRAGQALFGASVSVDRREWRQFAASLDLGDRYPGMTGLGYLCRLTPAELPAFEAAARAEGMSLFTVHPPSASDDVFPIRYVQPELANEAALGFDLGSQPAQRAAAERARDTGLVVASEPVALVQDAERKAGFLLFLPVYRRGAPTGTVEERRAALEGWVYAAFRAEDVMRRLTIPALPELDLEIFDAAEPTPESLLYDADPTLDAGTATAATLPVEIGGRTWTLRFATRPPFDAATRNREPLFVLVGGLLASALILGIVSSLVWARARALTTAEERARALRQSEASLRAILDNVVDGIVTFGEGGGITSLNAAAERMFAYSLPEVLGRPIEFLVPEARGDIRDGFRNEATGRRRDGTLFPMELTVSGTRQRHRYVFIAMVRDITARRRAELRQAAQHAATRALAESPTLADALPEILATLCATLGWSVGVYWKVDREAQLLRPEATWSPDSTRYGEFERLTRETSLPTETGLPGRVWQSREAAWLEDIQKDLTVPRALHAAHADLHGCLAAPVAIGGPPPHGGEVLGILEFLSRRRMAEPDPELVQTLATIGSQIAQFIERDAADRALRAGDERMRAVLENMLEGLIVVNEAGIIESVNPAAERIFGYAKWELEAQHVKMLLPRALLASADSFLKDASRKALGRVSEWEARRKNGEVFRFELSMYVFETPEGRRFAGHVRDVSERARLERMKKEFVATVSHELRTPLTSIRGSLSLLAGGALGDLPDEAREVVSIAERNTLRLITLINDILDLERLESGRLELSLEDLDAARILERSLESIRGVAEQHGVALEVGSSPARVFGDGDRLVQVLVNLLSNAVKFSPKGGVVTVDCATDGPWTVFRVRDRGRGIPRSFHEAIFQRFQQVEASDSRQKGGTGLGLAISKAIVEQHGGVIGVDSEPGKGSAFWFRVPARRQAGEGDRLLASLRGSFEDQADVLLVEDDEAMLGVMTRLLLQEGVPVRTARTLAEGLRLARERPPALLVLDLRLPDGDGSSLVETLRADPTLKDSPLLVYTVRDLGEEERMGLRLGPTRFLTKSRASDEQFRDVVLEMVAAWTAGRSSA